MNEYLFFFYQRHLLKLIYLRGSIFFICECLIIKDEYIYIYIPYMQSQSNKYKNPEALLVSMLPTVPPSDLYPTLLTYLSNTLTPRENRLYFQSHTISEGLKLVLLLHEHDMQKQRARSTKKKEDEDQLATIIMPTNNTEADSYLLGNYHFNGNILLTSLAIVIFVLTAYNMLQCLNRYLVTGHVMSSSILYHFSSVRPTNSTTSSSGLHPSVVAALPIMTYQKGRKDTDINGDGSVECVVCLGQMEEGEKVRVLPGCQHLFHVDCIDMWLFSHSTCPVCRANAEPPDPRAVNRDLSGAHPSIEVVQDLERQQPWFGLVWLVTVTTHVQ